MYTALFKRLLDFTSAFIGLVIISPIFIVLFLSLILANKGQAFFTQQRPGKNGCIFKVIKFKTMNDRKDKEGNMLPPTERITKVGSFLRKTSLDEIPQLLNVIKGDMSLVGPRPLRIEYLPLYTEEQNKRHNVRPGITGWAQVNGRNTVNWEERFALDVWYTENINFKLDFKILLLTLKKVVKREDIDQDSGNTMTPFGDIKLDS